MRYAILPLAILISLAGCGGDDPCRCRSEVLGGELDVACGEAACLGGNGYRCQDRDTVVDDPTVCGLAPAGPDLGAVDLAHSLRDASTVGDLSTGTPDLSQAAPDLISAAPDLGLASGVGTTIAECNGPGLVSQYGPSIPTTTTDVTTVWVYGTDALLGKGNIVFGYTRAQVASRKLPLTGSAGEQQIKLFVYSANATLVPGTEYNGVVALSTWDAAQSKWATAAYSDVVVITIDDFFVDATAWSNGSYCAGRLLGHAQGIISGTGADLLDFYFAAPLLTPNFPS